MFNVHHCYSYHSEHDSFFSVYLSGQIISELAKGVFVQDLQGAAPCRPPLYDQPINVGDLVEWAEPHKACVAEVSPMARLPHPTHPTPPRPPRHRPELEFRDLLPRLD